MPPLNIPATGLVTDRLKLQALDTADAAELLQYQLDNRQHLQPWEPLRDDAFYTIEAIQRRIAGMVYQMSEGNALHLLIRDAQHQSVIGECNFTNIVRGPFQACHLGFSISASAQGKGLMYEALEHALDFVFETYALHRVMANYRPENVRSGKLLARLGFETEGTARAYLKINGQWADHVLTSCINDKMQ
ncbi:ribosomal protein S5-alanine N-acetyltransferase [Paraburkholderia bannensis]|uniref:ribosomal protein S5-alanine N-acetyltransferase n=1 Tax=Paraburkholderia bannensis TaxID=765414 RepID=UPI002AB7C529|nr:ribosomal protein S5-alanine N-acetyltransferase [Paraburkholderia bannensis]